MSGAVSKSPFIAPAPGDRQLAIYSSSLGALTTAGATIDDLATSASVSDAITSFAARRDNPNQVTAAQVGAINSDDFNSLVNTVGSKLNNMGINHNGELPNITSAGILAASGITTTAVTTAIAKANAAAVASSLGTAAAANIGTGSGNVIARDGTGKLPADAIPASLIGDVQYQGAWNASTNTPTIPAAATGNKGWYYVVSVAGTTSEGGITDWQPGDWLISDGTTWTKIDNTDAVKSVNGMLGVITGLAVAANNLSDLSNAAAARTNLGLANTATVVSSAFGQTLIALSDATAGRAALGLGSAATLNAGTGAFNLVQLNASGDLVGTFLIRIDTDANLAAVVPGPGELTYGTTTRTFKIGDNVTAWASLPPASPSALIAAFTLTMSIADTTTAGFSLVNSSAATSYDPTSVDGRRRSPGLSMASTVLKETINPDTSISTSPELHEWRIEERASSGLFPVSGVYFQQRVNGGAWTDRLAITNNGVLTAQGGIQTTATVNAGLVNITAVDSGIQFKNGDGDNFLAHLNADNDGLTVDGV